MADRRKGYIDVDTTDEFLDLPEPVYQPAGKPGPAGPALDELMSAEYRREHNIGPLPALPPLTEH